MRSTSRTNGGLILLYHFLTLPTTISSFASSSRSAFLATHSPSTNQGINNSRQQQQQRQQRHVVLFSSSTTTNGNNNNRVVPKALGTSGNWSAYLDESKGLIYYFNPTTGESKWEAPSDADFSTIEMEIDGAKKAEMRERLKTYLEERLNNSNNNNKNASSSSSSSSSNDIIGAMQNDRRTMEYKRKEASENLRMKQSMISSSKNKSSTSAATRSTSTTTNPQILSPANNLLAEQGQYQALIDTTRGRIYYHNRNTRESTWTRPAGFPEFKVSASKRVAMEAQFQRYTEWHDGSGVGNGVEDSVENPRAKVNVLGRGVVSVSDFSYEDGLEAEEETAAVDDSAVSVVTDAKVDEEPTNPVIPNTTETKRPNSLPIIQQGSWSAYFDIKSGVVFYFDETTGSTSWDPPFKDFPGIIMEGSVPKVLDSSSIGNISMERALGYIGVDEMAEALKWEEAKEEERRRKAVKRKAAEAAAAEVEATTVVEIEKESTPAVSAEPEEGRTVEMYEAVKNAELERLEQEKIMAEEKKAAAAAAVAATKLTQEENTRLEKERIAAQYAAAKEREVAAKLAIQEKLEQELSEKEERLESERVEEKGLEAEAAAAKLAGQEKLEQKERVESERVEKEKREASAKLAIQKKLEQELLEKERLERVEKERLEAEEAITFQTKEVTQPVLPKEDPTITAQTIETMVAPLKTRTLYDILQCSTTASRKDLKRSYLSLAKQSHPDALLQMGKSQNDETERRFAEITQAWKILGDSTSRRRYDRELRAKGISSKAGNIFEGWVMGAAKVMDEALAKAENDLENGGEMRP